MKNSRWLIVLAGCLFALAIGCAKKEESAAAGEAVPTAAAPAFDRAIGTASVSGKVSFQGTPPAPSQIKMNADAACVAMHKEPVYAEDIVVTNGMLENVFVYVKEGLEKYTFAVPADPVVIRQEGCRYVPHVSGAMVNQKIKLVNNDPTPHNIHCWAEKNPQFNIGQPLKGMATEKTFTVPEVMIHFRCDVHKWMSSYLGILPHPYFGITGREGTFLLKDLPPGEYVIEAWHEKYPAQTQKVTLGDRETKVVDFTFKAS